MENLERTQFIVLTGHLDEKPLPDLVRTLRAQRKSGRLQVEYPEAPGAFFFEEGQLVDAQLGTLRGVEAVHAALALRGAAFNFNPLVRPPERSIDRQGQKFVQDLIEVPRREGLSEIRLAPDPRAGAAPALQPAVSALPPAPQNALVRLEPRTAAELTAPLEARLTAVEAAIAHTSRRFSRERLIYALVIAFLVGLTAATALQAILDVRRRASVPAQAQATQPAANNESARLTNDAARAPNDASRATDATNETVSADASRANATPNAEREQGSKQEQANVGAIESQPDAARQNARALKRAEQQQRAARQSQAGAGVVAAQSESRAASGDASGASNGYVVQVLMDVKGGRVTEARVLNPRPGGEAYEALALRMARQRRYPDNFTGGDTWKIKLKP